MTYIEIKEWRSKCRVTSIVVGVSIESKGREIMRGKGDGRKERRLRI